MPFVVRLKAGAGADAWREVGRLGSLARLQPPVIRSISVSYLISFHSSASPAALMSFSESSVPRQHHIQGIVADRSFLRLRVSPA